MVLEVAHGEFSISAPSLLDGAAVWQLVGEQVTLDRNTAYAYLLLCTRFAPTCRVARASSNASSKLRAAPDAMAGAPAAVLLGFLLPERPDTYFVWQIAVRARFRGLGLGRALICDALRQHARAGVRFVEAHVGPANLASKAMFHSVARALGAAVCVEPEFEPAHFPEEHAPELLLRIGPFNSASLESATQDAHETTLGS